MVLDSVNFYLKSNTSLIVGREMEYDLKSIGSRKSKLLGKLEAKKTPLWVFRVFSPARYHRLYALVIARFRVQYDQYLPSFSYFADLFTELFTEIAKYEKRGKYWPYCAR